jgi:hypothetical protein
LLIVTYLLSAFTTGQWISAVQLLLFVSAAVLALWASPMNRRIVSWTSAAALTGSVIAFVLALTVQTNVVLAMANIWAGLVLLLAVVIIVRRVLSFGIVTVQSIYGAISAYLLIGLMFAAFFAAMGHLSGSDFFASGQPANTRTFQYFSFVTLTTLGYGDFTAAANSGRAVAVLEALTGQVFLATLVARLVTGFHASRERAFPVSRPSGPAGELDDLVAKLDQLKKLADAGALTPEEFSKAKHKLLG